MSDIVIEKFSEYTPKLVARVLEMEQKVFDSPLSEEIVSKELEGRTDILALFAFSQDVCCGYKIGFQHSPEIFYSWIGGVVFTYRRRGIATLLMETQHAMVKAMGYKFVRTSTRNKYREMLLLNIKFGFDVTGVQKKLKETDLSIVLEKEL
jgi:predicted GNAT superfamily acetyltransferase